MIRKLNHFMGEKGSDDMETSSYLNPMNYNCEDNNVIGDIKKREELR